MPSAQLLRFERDAHGRMRNKSFFSPESSQVGEISKPTPVIIGKSQLVERIVALDRHQRD